MINNNALKIFEFPVFRLVRLLYSIPVLALFFWGCVTALTKLEHSELSVMLKLVMYAVCLVTMTTVIVKLFFLMNTRVVIITTDEDGFQMGLPGHKKILWSQVKSCSFPRDKYEIRANEPASTIILGFGFMEKPKIIKCSTWTIFSQAKRKKYQQDFNAFRETVTVYCELKLQ